MRKGEKWGESREHRMHLNVQPNKKTEFINEKRGGGRGQAEGINFPWPFECFSMWPLAVVPSELCLGKAEVWITGNQHPVLITGHVGPGGPSSAWRIFFQDISQAGNVRRIRPRYWVGSLPRGVQGSEQGLVRAEFSQGRGWFYRI